MGLSNRDYNQGTYDHDYYVRQGPWSVTMILIVANVVMFFVDGFATRAAGGEFFAQGPVGRWLSFTVQDGVLGFQAWRWLTFQFLHAGLWHILFNMMILFYLGKRVESYLGSKRFLAFYLLCGIAGPLLYLVLWLLGMALGNPSVPFLMMGDPRTPMVGASAGIFGVLVAMTMIAPHERFQLLFPPIAVTMYAVCIVLLLIALYNVMVAGPNSGGDAAHLGGAAAGFLLIKRQRWLNWADKVNVSAADAKQKFEDGKWARQQKQAQAEEDELDALLAKVSEKGLGGLSGKEKKRLNQLSEAKRDGR